MSTHIYVCVHLIVALGLACWRVAFTQNPPNPGGALALLATVVLALLATVVLALRLLVLGMLAAVNPQHAALHGCVRVCAYINTYIVSLRLYIYMHIYI